MAPSSFHAGDTVHVYVTVVNASSEPQTIEKNQCGRPFVVRSVTGDVVGPDPLACFTYSAPYTLAPGERYTWPAMVWMGRGSTPQATPKLMPGEYWVTGAATIPYNNSTTTARLDTLAIHVLP